MKNRSANQLLLLLQNRAKIWTVVEDSTGSTYNYGDYTNDNAFFWSSIDLSAFAGTDLGYTPFRIRVLDAAGKLATGYLAGVGAGETLGDELITGWTNFGYETLTLDGINFLSAIESAGDGTAQSNNTGLNSIELLKLVVNITWVSGDYKPTLWYKDAIYFVGQSAAGVNTIYFNTLSGGNSELRFYNSTATSWEIYG